jgi:hypothetical protein
METIVVPFTYKNTIEFHVYNSIPNLEEYIINSIVIKLKILKPRNLSINLNRISFNGSFFRLVGRFNLLNSINYGEINIAFRDNKLIMSYKLKFLQLVFVSLTIPILFALFIDQNNIPLEIFLLGMIAIVCFGLNYCITILRFHNFIQKNTTEGLLKSEQDRGRTVRWDKPA